MKHPRNTTPEWTETMTDDLEGRTITAVRYLSDHEALGLGLNEVPVGIFFDDGSYILVFEITPRWCQPVAQCASTAPRT